MMWITSILEIDTTLDMLLELFYMVPTCLYCLVQCCSTVFLSCFSTCCVLIKPEKLFFYFYLFIYLNHSCVFFYYILGSPQILHIRILTAQQKYKRLQHKSNLLICIYLIIKLKPTVKSDRSPNYFGVSASACSRRIKKQVSPNKQMHLDVNYY